MKGKNFVITFVIFVIAVAGILWFFKNRSKTASVLPVPTPNITSKIEKAFPNLVIPQGVERAELIDKTGGEGVGVATRTEIVANLPTLTTGKFYQGWLENSDGKAVLVGNFRISKSGWILNYNSTKYPGYNKVLIKQGNATILEGSF